MGRVKNFEAQAQAIDSLLKAGAIKELGFFDVETGYTIVEAASRADAMKVGALFYPNVLNEPHEIIPWEEAKKVISSAYSAQAQQR